MNARRFRPLPSPVIAEAKPANSPTLPAPPTEALLAESGLPLYCLPAELPLPTIQIQAHREIFDEYGPLEELGPAEVVDASGVYEVQLFENDLRDRVGSFDCVPVVQKTLVELRALPLDPASVYIVSTMDGMVSIEMLFDLAPIPRDQVVRALCLLFDHGVISPR